MSEATGRIRPKDAASLVIYDRTGNETRFLMGVRAAGHLFMPGHLVFPGGRLEPSDVRVARLHPLASPVLDRLMAGSPRPRSPFRAAALALAAIRETQEETGLLVAERGVLSPLPTAWEAFSAAGAVPNPSALIPFARAITPPGLPRRFDARFFLASAECLLERPEMVAPPSNEFDAVIWVGSKELMNYRVAPITQAILDLADARIAQGSAGDPSVTIPFFRRGRNGSTIEYL